VKISFIGLGAMGAGIVSRLIAAGHTLTGWNRTKEKAESLITAGMKWANSPRAAASESEVVFSMVTDAVVLRTVALGPEGIIAGLSRDGIYLDMSTIAPEESRGIAQEFEAKGLTMLDAPISGSTVTLKSGKASIMVGGSREAFERVRGVLLDIGSKVTYIGGQGMAAQMKLAVNLVLMVEVIAFGEAVALAEKGGVARDVAVEAMLNSVAGSPVLGYRGPVRSSWREGCLKFHWPTLTCSRRICCWCSNRDVNWAPLSPSRPRRMR
jgi:3-hydroxyisobutyrate dehydrogenase-like beta-hydroxyacid dehydrogenase